MTPFIAIALLSTVIISIAVIKLIFPIYIEPKTLKVQTESTYTQITYRALKAYDVIAGAVGFVLFIAGTAIASFDLYSDDAFVIFTMGAGMFVLGMLYIINGYTSKSLVAISSTWISLRYRTRFGSYLREVNIDSEIFRVYYAKGMVRQGELFSVLADTSDELQVLLMTNIYSEEAAVAIKDVIIARRNLSWSSKTGKGPMLEVNWRGKFEPIPKQIGHRER